MSPRRSGRSRSSHHPPGPGNSSSQHASAKGERNTRPNNPGQNRTASPRGASTVRSESMDDAESTSRSAHTAESSVPPRRSLRRNDSESRDRDKELKQLQDEDEDIEEEAIEEEVTRCICGHTEYPGPSVSIKEQWTSSEPISEDVGNFFVQCDRCHVWQHGGCMGLIDESIIPDEYYCELCKPEYHKIMKSATSTKSSRYIPVLEGLSDRSTPLSTIEAVRKGNGKNKPLELTKRRATMNSRGAYDEDEMIRRAIEESKEMGTLGKRTRDDNEEQRQIVKRQRTGSDVSSVDSRHSASPTAQAGDQGLSTLNGTRTIGRLRGGAVKITREKEIRDKQKEHIAAQRAEAASKRNARSERRRGEDSPPPTPTLSPSKPAPGVGTNTKPKAETPPVTKAAVHRKGGRPPARRGRLGRNQYTREMGMNGDAGDGSLRDTSHDRNHDYLRLNINGNINGESGRSSKVKIHPARTSMNEMKRRVAAILEFVGHMQTERASQSQDPTSNQGQTQSQNQSQTRTKTSSNNSDMGEGRRSRSSGNSSTKGNSTPNGSRGLGLGSGSGSGSEVVSSTKLVEAVTEGLQGVENHKAIKSVENDGDLIVDTGDGDGGGGGDINVTDTTTTGVEETPQQQLAKIQVKSEKEFDGMNAIEMMETLTKDLVSWQTMYGIYAR